MNSWEYFSLKSECLVWKCHFKLYSFRILTLCLHVAHMLLLLFSIKHHFFVHIKHTPLIITMSQLSTVVCYKHFPWTFLITKLTVQESHIHMITVHRHNILSKLTVWSETENWEPAVTIEMFLWLAVKQKYLDAYDWRQWLILFEALRARTLTNLRMVLFHVTKCLIK
jgi:hypothetical protein